MIHTETDTDDAWASAPCAARLVSEIFVIEWCGLSTHETLAGAILGLYLSRSNLISGVLA